MSDDTDKRIVDFATLLQLEKLARKAKNVSELGFVISNETFRLVPYLSNYFWGFTPNGFVKIVSASGTEVVNKDAPLVKWLKSCVKQVSKGSERNKIHLVDKTQFSKKIQKDWSKWMPENVLWCPFVNNDGELIGGLWLTKDKLWEQSQVALLELLSDAYTYSLNGFVKTKRKAFFRYFNKTRKKSGLKALIAFFVLMFMPITQTMIAPATVVPKDANVINSPINGVIKKIEVNPNQKVYEGQILITFDDTTLKNRYDIAKKSLEVAKAELRKTEQMAFSNVTEQANVVLLKQKIALHHAELEYNKTMLEKVNLRASKDGIAIFSDVSDWEGRPVSLGQKIMTIANPKNVELEIMIPASDAINLEKGAKIKAYLNINPLDVYGANLRYASYIPVMSEKGYSAYRARADFAKGSKLPRIGLQANAKIFADTVPLFYFLLRKPFAVMRKFIGF